MNKYIFGIIATALLVIMPLANAFAVTCNCAAQTCTSGGWTGPISGCSECNGVCASSTGGTGASTRPLDSTFLRHKYDITSNRPWSGLPNDEYVPIRLKDDGQELKIQRYFYGAGDRFDIWSKLTAEDLKLIADTAAQLEKEEADAEKAKEDATKLRDYLKKDWDNKSENDRVRDLTALFGDGNLFRNMTEQEAKDALKALEAEEAALEAVEVEANQNIRNTLKDMVANFPKDKNGNINFEAADGKNVSMTPDEYLKGLVAALGVGEKSDKKEPTTKGNAR